MCFLLTAILIDFGYPYVSVNLYDKFDQKIMLITKVVDYGSLVRTKIIISIIIVTLLLCSIL